MPSWRFKSPGLDQVGVALCRDDGKAVHVIYLTIEFLDSEGWHVRLYERAEVYYARARWRRLS